MKKSPKKELKIRIPSFVFDKRFIIAALFILALAVRIMYKNAGIWHWDSLADILAVERMLEDGGLQYSYAYGAPGMTVLVFIFYFLHHLIAGAASAEPAYFFVTFVASALCVVFIYLISEKLTKDRFISIGAALLFNFTPIFLSVTTYPKTHSISLIFALLSIYYMILFNEKGREWMLLLSGLFLGYSITVRIFSVLFIFPLLFIYLDIKFKKLSVKLNRKKFDIKNLFIFGVPAALIWILLFYKKVAATGGVAAYIRSLFFEQSTAVGWQGFFSSSLAYSFSGLLKTMTILGAILFLAGLYYGFKKHREFSIMLLLWLIPPFFYFANIRMPHLRFFICFLPAIMILIAMGCRLVYSKNNIAGIVVLLLLIGWMFYTIHPVIKFRHEYSGTKEAAMWVASVTEPNAIIMSTDFGFFIEYYGSRKMINHPRTGNDEDIDKFIKELENYLNNGIPVYSTAEGFAIDPGQKVQQAILQNFDVAYVGEKANEVYQYTELELKIYNEKLFKFTKKQNSTENTAT